MHQQYLLQSKRLCIWKNIAITWEGGRGGGKRHKGVRDENKTVSTSHRKTRQKTDTGHDEPCR